MKRIVVLGAGESGAGAAVLAKVKGYDVFVSDLSAIKDNYKQLLDQYNIVWEEKQHTEALILNATEVIKSPGIPDKAPMIKAIKAAGIPIISEIEFAGRYTSAKMLCITGSNGKTTTTMLLYHILKSADYNVGLAGNVGNSLALQVATANFDYYVVELSSFQLDNMYQFKADIAILLNITPDHLDRYEYKMQNYIDSKMRITQNQTETDAFIFWNDDPVLKIEVPRIQSTPTLYPFAETKEKDVWSFATEQEIEIAVKGTSFSMPRNELALRGKHNLYNALAAATAAKIVGIDDTQLRIALSNFNGVEHRLENAGTVNGIEYVNDSKATNVNSCWYALQSMIKPVVLILGGTDKGNDYSEIEVLVREKVKHLIFMGVDNTKLIHFFGSMDIPYTETGSMNEAIAEATKAAHNGDCVLLSPCCASFDLFKNYEDRGEQFKACVKNL